MQLIDRAANRDVSRTFGIQVHFDFHQTNRVRVRVAASFRFDLIWFDLIHTKTGPSQYL